MANVAVITNAFVIKSLPTKPFHQYDVFQSEGNIDSPPPPKRQRLIHALQTIAYPNVFQPQAVYDGNKLLYASHIVPDGIYRVHGSNPNAPPGARGWYEIKISRTKGTEVVPSHVNQLMTQGSATTQTITATNLLQLLLSQAANLKYPNNTRAYFTPDGKRQIPGMAVELWRGFFQSVRPSIGRMLVNVDMTVAAMYLSGPLIDVAMAVLNVRDARKLALHNDRSEDFKKLEKYLKKRLITVQTNPRSVKTIRGLVPGPVGRYEFHRSGSGPVTTIGIYYEETYRITLRFPDMIGVLTSGKSAPFPVVIPLELCKLNPGQLYKKKLPPEATREVVSFAAVNPADRLRTIRQGAGGRPDQLRSPVQEYAENQFMLEAGMRVDLNALTVPGRLLNVPRLVYGPGDHGNTPKLITPRDGAWNVLHSRFYTPQSMMRWAVVNFDHRIPPPTVQRVITGITGCCRELGMTVGQVNCVRTGDMHNVKQTLADVIRELGGAKEVDIIIVLLPTRADDIRTLVKYTSDCELGVRTQCLREQNIQRANNQYWNNVALKLNARLGGVNALVDSPVLKELKSKPFMIMGYDVSHPSPGVNRPSVCSLVWSHDQHGAAYCATTRVQEPRKEITNDLKDMVVDAILMFGNKHRVAPASVYFYRDGVSEGEFAQVQNTEIEAIKGAFEEVWRKMKLPGPLPKLTFLVVGKRHHFSFFPPSPNDEVGDRTGNCRAGLVVDKGLANPQFPDFYLQSHAAIKGTSRSGHYTVLLDENFGGNLGKLQELSFALCHVYAKATRSVSIPAPVYYADLACARGKFHIDPVLNMDLDGSTTTDGKEEATLDLQRWKAVYQSINANIQGSMYFL
ncbi:argonaute-like protein [Mycena belliarum]|uniref:Argonaute-like protein n=1 Tax=Mycena belliarum TaxID=1033014 RepID=A0AAD6U5P1_9AGAR|nr:argonaute-like protein [Mycena belliae]